jgi:hypothetical protein
MSGPSIPDAMATATSHGTWFVTKRQLWLAWSAPTTDVRGYYLAALVLPAVLYIFGAGDWGGVGTLAICGGLGGLAWLVSRRIVPNEDDFDDALSEYIRRFGPPPKLLLEPRLRTPPEPAPEGDTHAHGAAGILLVDDDLLVDLLVLNNVHATNGLAVVSTVGYPDYLLETLQPISVERPLYLLHGSKTSYPTMVAAARALFPGRTEAPTRDLGVENGHAWIPRTKGLRRDRHQAPDGLRVALLVTLLRSALDSGSTLAQAHRVALAASRRSSSSSFGDSHGWG